MRTGKRGAGKRRKTADDVVGVKTQTAVNIAELISQLRVHFEKVKADDAFFSLKQSEFRRGNEVCFFGMLNAQEELDVERSLLVGHALMVTDTARKEHIALDRESERLLIAILNYGAGHVVRG
jgi:hypothetical protein